MKAGTWLCPHCYEEEHPDEVSPLSARGASILCFIEYPMMVSA